MLFLLLLFHAIFCANAFCGRRLAVLIPFVERQIPKLEQLMIEDWFGFAPFDQCHAHVRECVDLIFYYHKVLPVGLQQRLATIASSGPVMFKAAFVINANLSDAEDSNRITGANAMFRRLFCEPRLLDENTYSHMFLMEVDVHPLRPGWAGAAFLLIMCDNDDERLVWVRGSIYYGHDEYLEGPFHLMHINGNAFYSVQSAEFRDKCVCSLPLNDTEAFGYDVEMYWQCYNPRRPKMLRELVHHFRYTNFILNYYTGTSNDADLLARHPSAFLVHSKALVRSHPQLVHTTGRCTCAKHSAFSVLAD